MSTSLGDLFYSIEAQGIEKVGQNILNLGNAVTNLGNLFLENITEPLLDMSKVVIKTTMDFDKQMSRVSAVTGATGENFTVLRELAMDMGSSTSKTATEAAEAIEYMGLAGWDLTQIQKGLEPILRASEAGMMDLGITSDLVTDSMSALGLQVDDMGKYLDIAAMAQNTSNQNMQQFLEAMVKAGGTFKMFNVPLEEAGSLLGILANRGYKGTEAATALTSIMNNLTVTSGDSGKAMESLKVNVYDTEGRFRGITVILKELNERFEGMTEAQKNTYIQMLGGKTRTKELNALLNGTSLELDDLHSKLQNTDGALNRMAHTMQNNLAGKITILKSVFEGISIQIGTILTPFIIKLVDSVIFLAESFYNLPSIVKVVTIGISILAGSIAPLLISIGTLISLFGGLVIAGSSLFLLISTIGLPIIGSMALGIIGVATQFIVIQGIILSVIGTITFLLAKIGLLSDGFATLKALISGDFTSMFDLLTERFGMSEEKAEILATAFENIYNKANILIRVIKDNLSTAFDILVSSIGNLITNGFDSLNGSSEESSSIFVNFVTKIVEWGGKLTNYLYEVFDSFGLIPTKLKFINDEIAGKFVELEAQSTANLNNILNSQSVFGENFTQKNKEIYNQKINDTRESLNEEMQLVIEQLNIRKTEELTALQSLFNQSYTLTTENEALKMEQLKLHYDNQAETIKNNNMRILEIIQLAYSQERELNQYEMATISLIRQDNANLEVKIISDSKAEQLRILEQSRLLATEITRSEGLAIIVEANKTYDSVIETARKQMHEKIETIIKQRDGTGIISKQEAHTLILEAEHTYKGVVREANKTKNDTINLATQKSNGVISEADKEKREVTGKTEQLKSAMKTIWNDVKKQIPSIVIELMLGIIKAIENNSAAITSAAFKAGAALVGGMISGIASKLGALASKVGEMMSMTGPTKVNIGSIGKNAEGTTNWRGGWTWVGEDGPEIINLPKGSAVYSNKDSMKMVGEIQDTNNISNNKQEVFNFNGNVILDSKSINEFENVIDFFKTLKIEANMR